MGKFFNQWYFIAMNFFFGNGGTPIIRSPSRSPVLRRALGTYLPRTECKIKDCKDHYNSDPSVILVQRSSKKEGFGCDGDSGGPSVVEHEGSFILVGLMSYSPNYPPNNYLVWPPPCYCCA